VKSETSLDTSSRSERYAESYWIDLVSVATPGVCIASKQRQAQEKDVNAGHLQ